MQRETTYQGKAALARTLHSQPTRPTFNPRPWIYGAWLVVGAALIAVLMREW